MLSAFSFSNARRAASSGNVSQRWPKVGFYATREHGQRLVHE